MEKNFITLKKDDLQKTLGLNFKTGLSTLEVMERADKFGKNTIIEEKNKSIFEKFVEQFKNLMIIILLFAGVLSVVAGDYKDATIIFLVVILNAILGFIQQYKADKALQEIKDMTQIKNSVLRDGKLNIIDSISVVPGDIIYLKEGDFVPADGRIIENFSLQIDESMLTGESLPILKTDNAIDTIRGIVDLKNCVFKGSVVTGGRGFFLVNAIGMETEIGKIATMLSEAKKQKTPLEKKLDILGKKIAFIVLLLSIVIFIFRFYQGYTIRETFNLTISLAVAAIPEGLAIIMTIILAAEIQKMSKHKAIVKSLHSVETSGSITTICSDKTGTLTKNEMTVVKAYYNKNYDNLFLENEYLKKIKTFSLICNNTHLEGEQYVGTPTEKSLFMWAKGDEESFNQNQFERIAEVSFDSSRKMSTVFIQKDQKVLQVTIGAPDILIDKLSFIDEEGKISEITLEQIERIKKINEEMAGSALRVIMITYQKREKLNENPAEFEKNLIFIALVGIIDPPRDEVHNAINECYQAGIKPVMITGDHKNTAVKIAENIGILKEGDLSISGYELDQLSDDEISENIQKYKVFARVTPEHKLKIVRLLQKKGEIVAMTGDGVNDAPALKEADIGISMGQNGSEVAKEASDIVLVDNNFATIVFAIRSGRNIYSNLKKAIQYLLSCNISEVFALIFSIIFFPVIFKEDFLLILPVQILWINLSDSIISIMIGLEKEDKNIMKHNPLNPTSSIFDGNVLNRIFFNGILISFASVLGFFAAYFLFSEGMPIEIKISISQSSAFMTMAFSQFFMAYNARNSSQNLIALGIFSNKGLNISIAVFSFLQLIVFIKPLDSFFKVHLLSLYNWLFIIILSLVTLILAEYFKRFPLIKGKENTI